MTHLLASNKLLHHKDRAHITNSLRLLSSTANMQRANKQGHQRISLSISWVTRCSPFRGSYICWIIYWVGFGGVHHWLIWKFSLSSMCNHSVNLHLKSKFWFIPFQKISAFSHVFMECILWWFADDSMMLTDSSFECLNTGIIPKIFWSNLINFTFVFTHTDFTLTCWQMFKMLPILNCGLQKLFFFDICWHFR